MRCPWLCLYVVEKRARHVRNNTYGHDCFFCV
jgi:hypothetical protein